LESNLMAAIRSAWPWNGSHNFDFVVNICWWDWWEPNLQQGF
jgi:hypothetical protein